MTGNLTQIWRRMPCQNLVLAALSGVFVGGLFGCALILSSQSGHPVVVHEEHEVDGRATLNGHLDLYIDLDRKRDCPSETSRWLWTWVEHGGQRVRQFYPLLNTNTTLTNIGDDQRLILSIPLPPGLWPGEWFYWSKTVERCPLLPSLFRTPLHESSNIPIRIVTEMP